MEFQNCTYIYDQLDDSDIPFCSVGQANIEAILDNVDCPVTDAAYNFESIGNGTIQFDIPIELVEKFHTYLLDYDVTIATESGTMKIDAREVLPNKLLAEENYTIDEQYDTEKRGRQMTPTKEHQYNNYTPEPSSTHEGKHDTSKRNTSRRRPQSRDHSGHRNM